MHTNRVIGQANLLKYYPCNPIYNGYLVKNYIDTEDWNIGLIVLLEELEEEYKYSTVREYLNIFDNLGGKHKIE